MGDALRHALAPLLLVAVALAGCTASPQKVKPMSDTGYQLALLKIPVTEITRSAAFYREALGFEQQFAAEEYGWAQFAAGDLAVALYKPGMGPEEVGRRATAFARAWTALPA